MLLPCIGKRMINIYTRVDLLVCVMSPSDGIRVKVGLKICLSQSSSPGKLSSTILT